MAKKLRDIAGKGQFSGVRKSTVAPPDIDDKNLYQWNGPDGVKFIKKHDTETHDYPYDAEAAFKGKKGGGSKTTKYNFQKDGVYEEVSCNHSGAGVHCEMHGEDDCSSAEPKDMPKKGQKVLNDGKKKVAEENIDEGIRGMRRKDTAYKDDPKKYSNVYPKNFKQPGTPSKQSLRDIAKQAANDAKITKLPAGKAKGIKEDEEINEVAPPNPKIEKWIKANKERFIKEYGKEKGTQVLYAKAWKMHGQSESGTSNPATNTDYAGPGAAGWSTGRHDVGTL